MLNFRSAYREGFKVYIRKFWSWIELLVIVLSIVCVAIYIYKHIATNSLTSKFKESHGNAYIKFQYAGYWTEILMYVVGWLVSKHKHSNGAEEVIAEKYRPELYDLNSSVGRALVRARDPAFHSQFWSIRFCYRVVKIM